MVLKNKKKNKWEEIFHSQDFSPRDFLSPYELEFMYIKNTGKISQ